MRAPFLDQLQDRDDRCYWGKFRGFVVDNQDPQARGRLRAIVPEVMGDVVLGWAEPCFAYGGTQDLGHYHVPPVCKDGDGNPTTGVWIEFRGGDPSFPIWVGTFPAAPGDVTEAPGDDAAPSPDVQVFRSYAGHSMVTVDTPGAERMELRDASGQRITFSGPMKDGTKRDENGAKATETQDVDYPDLAANQAHIEITDFAGNSVKLDADKAAPTLRLTNTDRDGNVLQTVELHGASSDPKIVISDNNDNVITLDQSGIRIEASGHGDTIVMNSQGIQQDAAEINLNSGTMGSARLNDKVQSTIVEDSQYWTWVNTLMTWLASHTHVAPFGPTTPPVVPFPGTVPSKCVGKIIESSNTVIVGD